MAQFNYLKTFGYIMIFCSMLVLLFFLIKKGPLYLNEAWAANQAFLEIKTGILIQWFKYIIIVIISFVRVLINPEVIYYLAYGSLAVLATEIHPFFFAFHLTEFLLRYPTLRNILRSVYEPYISLILTFILVLLFIYFFTIFGYVFFISAYKGRCDELYMCFFETFDQTFKNNGGLGGYYESNVQKVPNDYNYGRFFIENFANIAVNIIAIQIFSGIIIDKFSQLRDDEQEKMFDISEMCFICGHTRYFFLYIFIYLLKREIFDRKSDEGFSQHIKNEHYLWNYVFYLAYLKEKESTEYTGIESYVYEKLEQNDISWFPIQRATILIDEERKIQQENNEIDDFENQVILYYFYF
ncbi:MIR domain protein [Ichthyophthirius multifiliis]|uniref:MIR domain protein n=1 Tax=Ichthyophthirius multifiliis TaxID=5932 RepID=G0QP88_ICHMU|nr:MIR domain protein [Ichthyophthirius multifiliis]EGR32968.1 MIR domain protein [Ichthyophthirius multifiliis]|eukprot:XP_004036954.1 MIR domain protein [Ichthyophthirius multifiliis]